MQADVAHEHIHGVFRRAVQVAVVEDDEPRMVTRRRRLVISFARPPRPQHGHGADAAVSAGRVAGCRVVGSRPSSWHQDSRAEHKGPTGGHDMQ